MLGTRLSLLVLIGGSLCVIILKLNFNIYSLSDELKHRLHLIGNGKNKTKMKYVEDEKTKNNKMVFCNGVVLYDMDTDHPSSLNPQIHHTLPEIVEHFYRYTLEYIDAHCESIARFGRLSDGGWDVCMAPPYQPGGEVGGQCRVLSFGINYDFSFDDDVAKKFNCTVHSFDPSMAGLSDHQRGKNIWFHRTGLSNVSEEVQVKNKTWQLHPLSTLLQQLQWETEIIDILKFDVEGAELPALDAMLKHDSLRNVKQLMFEVHLYNVEKDPLRGLIFTTDIFRRLRAAGFKKYLFHENVWNCVRPLGGMIGPPRTHCFEFYFINLHFLPSSCYVEV